MVTRRFVPRLFVIAVSPYIKVVSSPLFLIKLSPTGSALARTDRWDIVRSHENVFESSRFTHITQVVSLRNHCLPSRFALKTIILVYLFLTKSLRLCYRNIEIHRLFDKEIKFLVIFYDCAARFVPRTWPEAPIAGFLATMPIYSR